MTGAYSRLQPIAMRSPGGRHPDSKWNRLSVYYAVMVSAVTTRIRIPGSLRRFTGGQEEVSASGHTVAEVIQDLDRQCPGLRDSLLDSQGVRGFVMLCVGESDIRFLKGLDTEISTGDTLTIVPAIAGG